MLDIVLVIWSLIITQSVASSQEDGTALMGSIELDV